MISVSRLLWSGARCCTKTKAIPGSTSGGIPEKNASKAARPPAEAPMPTTGKSGVGTVGFRGLVVFGAGFADPEPFFPP
jgi:hypothetical protein